MKAQFITIEGGEGVGKSTNLKRLQQLIEARGHQVVVTREPGGTPLAEEIRACLLTKREEPVSADCELLLMFASRVQHVERLIRPALEDGKWVLCDRFTDATFAYQGGGRGLDWQRITELENWSLQGFKPNATFFLDLDPKVGLERASKRGALDRFESESQTFFDRVRAAYGRRIEEDPVRFWSIDASQSLEQVQNCVEKAFTDYYEQLK